jgi:beta-mannanase
VKDTDFYYPGDQYVDMVGMDYYADDMSQVNNHGNYDKLIALNKPFGFAEIGPQSRSGFDNNLVLEAVRTKYPQTVYAMYWTGWSNLGVLHTKRGIIENANAKAFMNNPIIITLKGLQKLF